jgi:AIPR protein
MDELTAGRITAGRRRILRDNYRLHLFFVTLGKVSETHRHDAESNVRRARCEAALEVIDGKRIMVIFRDYLDGVAPPVPSLDLEMEQVPGVRVSAISNRFDEINNIESWVFSMRGDAVGVMFEIADIRLFARNIRGFLGKDNPVNDGMLETLNEEPDRFFYYNNGVTIVCDRAEKKTSRGRDVLQVSNPQVINGQQTTRMLASSTKKATKAAVLVKVICVPREDHQSQTEYDELVSQIVAGTNWQTEITPSDRISEF